MLNFKIIKLDINQNYFFGKDQLDTIEIMYE
jgi:hypothetical protein